MNTFGAIVAGLALFLSLIPRDEKITITREVEVPQPDHDYTEAEEQMFI